MSVIPTSQNQRRALYSKLMIAIVAVLALLAVGSRAFGLDTHAIASVAMAAALAIAMLQFSALDEVAKQAHYVAWYWGSMVALSLIGFASIAAFALPGLSASWIADLFVPLWRASNPSAVFMAGLLTGPMLMLVGFSAWWAVYWLRRR